MAASVTERQVTITVTSDTQGTVAIPAPGSATEKIVSVHLLKAPQEAGFRITGITLSNTAQTAGTLAYSCKGPGTVTYSVVLMVSDVAIS